MTPMLLTLNNNTTVTLDAEDILVAVTKITTRKTPKTAQVKCTEIVFKCRDVAILVKETPLQVYAKLAELLNVDDESEPEESDDEADGDIHCPYCGEADELTCLNEDDPNNRRFHCNGCGTPFDESEAL